MPVTQTSLVVTGAGRTSMIADRGEGVAIATIAFRLLLTTLMRSDCPSTLSRSLPVKTMIARPRSLCSTPEMRGS